MQILLPSELTFEHQKVALAYLTEAHRFTPWQWRQALVAFDLLKQAVIVRGSEIIRFPAIYYHYVEDRYADHFIDTLYRAKSIEATGTEIWARLASQIVADLTHDGLYNTAIQGTVPRNIAKYDISSLMRA